MADNTGSLVPKTAFAGVMTISLQLLEEMVQYIYIFMYIYSASHNDFRRNGGN